VLNAATPLVRGSCKCAGLGFTPQLRLSFLLYIFPASSMAEQ
jgi:hypothetical protein